MFKITDDLAESMLTAAKTELDGGFFYIFAGPVPTTASEALDIGVDHTLLVTLSESADEVTGLTFAAASGGTLAKDGTEVWSGVIDTSGTPAFFRFCPSGDNGQGLATTSRLQGTIGGPSSGRDVLLGADTLTANGTNTVTINAFNVLQTLLT